MKNYPVCNIMFDVFQPLERLHSSHSTSSLFDSAAHGKPDRERPQSSASRDDGRGPSRDGHSQSTRRCVKRAVISLIHHENMPV